MNRYNNGTIFTNNNCIGCNKCISKCSIMGANVSVKNNGKNQIFVDSKKCTQCGICIDLCPHNAREFIDDTEDFFTSLQNGEKITVLISTSFTHFYNDKSENIFGYLKSLGVEKIYDSALGDNIALWTHTKYIKDHIDSPHDEKAFIANTCPSIIHKIERFYPYLQHFLIPVQSPIISAAIYIHKYLGDNNKIAFIGPCISKHNEIHYENTNNNINYVLTFKHFMKKISDIDISNFYGGMDLTPMKCQKRISFHGNFKDQVSQFFPANSNFLAIEGENQENFKTLALFEKAENAKITPLMIDFLSCYNGCHFGPGIERKNLSYEKILSSYADSLLKKEIHLDYEQYWNEFSKQFSDIDYSDFIRTYDNLYTQPFHIPESTYSDVFNSMLKSSNEKRRINCGSCGYNSCFEMAKAIAYGYNKKENCIHYMNEQLFLNFFTDRETGISNKIAFTQKAKELIENNPDKKYVVCAGDINRMKVINDLYGHANGDNVLRIIANTFSEFVKENGVCGRLGGGTFAIIFEYTPENLQKFHEIKIFDCSDVGMEFPVTMRFGLYIPDDKGLDLTTRLNCATLCMDKNASTSQNTFTLYSEDFRKQTIQEIDITAKLQPALNNKEFTLWFQPQYKALTGELIGAEALCRWIKPDGSMISPGVFIPIAEKNGFIKKLDIEIWHKAFETVHRWLEKGLTPVPISVNISRVSLENDSLIYTIRRFSDEYSIPTNLIHFEVTESAYMHDQMNMIERINKIRNLGYQIAMDDFGSGYSSLNTLKDLPIDILKLDMGFLRSKTNMDKGGKILSSLAHMAQNLDYTTIAEGVETQEQADFLKSIGIDVIQGFLYAKPMPEDNFILLLSSNTNNIKIERNKRTGIINMSNLYNPNSSESVMFDKLTGPAAIFEYFPKTKKTEILRINQKCLKVFGLDVISFNEVQKSLKSFFSKETKQLFLDSIKKSIETNSEVICVTKSYELINETTIWIKLHLWEISKNDDSYIIYVLVDDITDEKITESTLAITNKHLTSMLEQSIVGMCLMNVKVDLLNFMETVKIRFLKVNKEFTELSGYSEEEVLGWNEKDSLSVIHPLDRPGFIAASIKAFAKKYSEPFSYQYRAKHKDGHYENVKIIVNGIKQDDGSFLIFTNYTNLGIAD